MMKCRRSFILTSYFVDASFFKGFFLLQQVSFFLRTLPQQHATIKTLFDTLGQQEADDAIKVAGTPQAKRFRKARQEAEKKEEEPQVRVQTQPSCSCSQPSYFLGWKIKQIRDEGNVCPVS